MRANLSHGVDWIKTTSTERAGLPETDPRRQLYTDAEVKVMVEEAATKGIPVMAHAHGEEGAMAAVQAGSEASSTARICRRRRCASWRRKARIWCRRTRRSSISTEPGGDYDNRDLLLRGRHMLPRLRETVQRAMKLNVKIVTGANTSYGPASAT